MVSQAESTKMDIDSPPQTVTKDESDYVLVELNSHASNHNGTNGQTHVVEMADSISPIASSKLQDAVMSILKMTSPSTFVQFLDPRTNTFKAVYGKKDMKLVIWRKGIEVFIGTFEHHTSIKAYRFPYLAGYLIGYDGAWHMQVTAKNAYCAAKWNDVWAGKFESYGGVERMSVQVEVEDMEKVAGDIASSMLEGRVWEGKVDMKCS